MMGDWLKLKSFDFYRLSEELRLFANDWKPYNPEKPNNRFGLSVTSLDGGLSGVPDLDSLGEYNKKNNTNLTNRDFTKVTSVYERCPTLQGMLAPYMPWLGRCHFIKLNKGGFFPEHYDHEKINVDCEDIRIIGFINNNNSSSYKFCYEDHLMTKIKDGDLYYFNAHKRHSVFSMTDDCIQIVLCLRFDESLFKKLLEQYEIK